MDRMNESNEESTQKINSNFFAVMKIENRKGEGYNLEKSHVSGGII